MSAYKFNLIRVLITSACNLNCTHCYQCNDKNKFFLSKDKLFEIADFAEKYRTKTLIISGGEVFMHASAYEFLEYCLEKSFDINLVTNATNINLSFFEKYAKNDKLSIQVSIDGMREAHDLRRGVGSFEKTINNARALSDMGIPVTVSMALDEQNYKDAIKVLNLPFIEKVNFLPVAKIGAACFKEIVDREYRQYEETMLQIYKNGFAEKSSTQMFPRELAIKYNGEIYPSIIAQDMNVLSFGNIMNQRLEEIVAEYYNSEQSEILKYSVDEMEECKLCSSYYVCDKGCRERAYKAYGTIASPDPFCCRIYENKFSEIPLGDIFWGNIDCVMQTERLILRKWRAVDVDKLVEGLNDYEMAYDFGTKYPYTKEDAMKYIADAVENDKLKYAIVLKDSDTLIGGCGIHIREHSASASIWIAKPHQRKGYATEAGRALTKYGFDKCGIKQFDNSFFEGNIASKKLQEKVGSKILVSKTNIHNDTDVFEGTRKRIRAILTPESYK